MNEAILIALIGVSCKIYGIQDKEMKIACAESLVNCMVGPGGVYKHEREFNQCLGKFHEEKFKDANQE